MIKSFRHKGLRMFFESGDARRIHAAHATKLARILDRLNAATSPVDMNLPGYKLHPLKGDFKEHWSVWVNGNWRVTFRFEGVHAFDVDYQDYH